MNSNFTYLLTPSSSSINPPIDQSIHELPIEQLNWKDFERLCLRIAEEYHSIDNCEIYGTPGQRQEGIDIFAKKPDGKFSTFQCKKYVKITPKDLDNAVSIFKTRDWSAKSNEFYFCTTFSLNSTQLQKKFLKLKDDLSNLNITFIKWDREQICRILKSTPQIVYDFFGAEWCKLFNGSESWEQLIKIRKLDSSKILSFRNSLFQFYKIVFNTHDAGIAIQNLNTSCNLQDRFIMPDAEDILSIDRIQNEEDVTSEKRYQEESLPHADSLVNMTDDPPKKEYKFKFNYRFSNRIKVDSLLTPSKRSIVLGDPGSGKSTLLKNLVLDILSPNPKSILVARDWGRLLPIWIPFAFITKQITKKDDLSIPEILKNWLAGYDKTELYPIIKDALDDERLILFIDGIDESIVIKLIYELLRYHEDNQNSPLR